MAALTASRAKEKFLSLLRKAHDFGAKYTITHNGKPYAVLMSYEEYEGLLETVEILKDKKATKELFQSLKEAEEGKTVSFAEVAGRKQKR